MPTATVPIFTVPGVLGEDRLITLLDLELCEDYFGTEAPEMVENVCLGAGKVICCQKTKHAC